MSKRANKETNIEILKAYFKKDKVNDTGERNFDIDLNIKADGTNIFTV